MVTEMKRLSAYLPDPVFEYLEVWATDENRSLSSLVGFLLERSARDRQKERGETMPVGKVEASSDRAELNELLSRLAAGEQVPDSELLIFAHQCSVEPETLIQLRNRVKGKNGNGNPVGA